MPLRLQFKSTDQTTPYRVFGNQKFQGKFISWPKKAGASTLRVAPCVSHERAVTVPVEVIIRKANEDYQVLGKGKACPLCWKLLKKDF